MHDFRVDQSVIVLEISVNLLGCMLKVRARESSVISRNVSLVLGLQVFFKAKAKEAPKRSHNFSKNFARAVLRVSFGLVKMRKSLT